MSKKVKGIFFKKSKIIIKEEEENIQENIQDQLDDINLKKFQEISKYKYNETIKNNMIDYIKNNNNINLKYDEWIKQFNELDYKNEFVDEIRNNEIYHKIWTDLNKSYKDFEILY